jgi:hypothetical protein
VQPLLSPNAGTRSGQPAPYLQDAAASEQIQPGLIHDAWVGWQYELPSEDDRISPSKGIQKPESVASRSDRVVAEFRVQSASEAAMRVSEAVALAELQAYAEQTRGVLVTRHGFDAFSVSLSSMVPFGLTIERDVAQSSPSAQRSAFNMN